MIHAILWLDTSVLNFLFSIRIPAVTLIFLDISELGQFQTIFGITLIISFFLLLHKRLADVAGLFISSFGCGLAVLVLKFLIQRPRPPISYQAYLEGPYYSFPSAHAGLSMAFYGFCVYLLLQTFPTPTRRFLIACLPVLIFLIGFSRLYLGVHYLSDVVAGFAIGAVFVWLGVRTRLYLLIRQDSLHESVL
jgi:membrane-associated phospholipid phosphatase